MLVDVLNRSMDTAVLLLAGYVTTQDIDKATRFSWKFPYKEIEKKGWHILLRCEVLVSKDKGFYVVDLVERFINNEGKLDIRHIGYIRNINPFRNE